VSDAETINAYLAWKEQHEGLKRDVTPEAWVEHVALERLVDMLEYAHSTQHDAPDWGPAYRDYIDATGRNG
jgi:hypothetical protein